MGRKRPLARGVCFRLKIIDYGFFKRLMGIFKG